MEDYLIVVIIVISIIWNLIRSIQKKNKKPSGKSPADAKKRKGLFARLNQYLQEQMQAIEDANKERETHSEGDGDEEDEYTEYDADPWIPRRKEALQKNHAEEPVSPIMRDDSNVESSHANVVKKDLVPGMPVSRTDHDESSQSPRINSTAKKLRKAIIWSEILAPPVSLRKM